MACMLSSDGARPTASSATNWPGVLYGCLESSMSTQPGTSHPNPFITSNMLLNILLKRIRDCGTFATVRALLGWGQIICPGPLKFLLGQCYPYIKLVRRIAHPSGMCHARTRAEASRGQTVSRRRGLARCCGRPAVPCRCRLIARRCGRPSVRLGGVPVFLSLTGARAEGGKAIVKQSSIRRGS
jgi:hypothetical protein